MNIFGTVVPICTNSSLKNLKKARATINIEDEIAKMARTNFENKIHADLVPEVQTDEWKVRTSFPIGMNDTGDLFYKSN